LDLREDAVLGEDVKNKNCMNYRINKSTQDLELGSGKERGKFS